MARFTDQFTRPRFNPRTFQPGILIPTWPALVQQDACAILIDVTDEEVIELAYAAEHLIVGYAEPSQFHQLKDGVDWIWTRVKPGWVIAHKLTTEDAIRNAFSDLNLLLAAIEDQDIFADSPWLSRLSIWHMLAVVALWKLIDARDVIFRHAPDQIGGLVRPKEQDRIMYASSLAMEAQAAISHALQLKERARHLVEAGIARDQIEKLKRKQKSKKAAQGKTTKHAPCRKQALKLANLGKYCGATHAINSIHGKVLYPSGKRVAKSTLREWLKLDGWKKYPRK
jgi:hypothetical protein